MKNSIPDNPIVELASDFRDPSLDFQSYLKLKVLKEYEIEDEELNTMILNSSIEDVIKAEKLISKFLGDTAVYDLYDDESIKEKAQIFIDQYGCKSKETLITYILLSNRNAFKTSFTNEFKKDYREFMQEQLKTRDKIKNVLENEKNEDEIIFNFIEEKMNGEDVIVFRPCATGEEIEQFFHRYPNVSKIIYADPFFKKPQNIDTIENELKEIDNNFTKETLKNNQINYKFIYKDKEIELSVFSNLVEKSTLEDFPKFNIYEQSGAITTALSEDNLLQNTSFFQKMLEINLLEHSFIVDRFNDAGASYYREFAKTSNSKLYGIPQTFKANNIGHQQNVLKPMYKIIIEVEKKIEKDVKGHPPIKYINGKYICPERGVVNPEFNIGPKKYQRDLFIEYERTFGRGQSKFLTHGGAIFVIAETNSEKEFNKNYGENLVKEYKEFSDSISNLLYRGDQNTCEDTINKLKQYRRNHSELYSDVKDLNASKKKFQINS